MRVKTLVGHFYELTVPIVRYRDQLEYYDGMEITDPSELEEKTKSIFKLPVDFKVNTVTLNNFWGKDMGSDNKFIGLHGIHQDLDGTTTEVTAFIDGRINLVVANPAFYFLETR